MGVLGRVTPTDDGSRHRGQESGLCVYASGEAERDTLLVALGVGTRVAEEVKWAS